MEKFMFDRLIEAAVARRIKRIVGIYRPTAKNGLVKKLYDQMGFRRVVRYELDLPATPVVTATHIRNVGPAAPRADEGHAKPKALRLHNGSELTSIVFTEWGASHAIEPRFIQPGKPAHDRMTALAVCRP